MVFESVVVDVLNRFLGDYVVNLDCSQLSLGIWGGRLELRIPWKNLYTQSVEATLDEVYLLIVPTAKNPKAEKQDTFVEKLVTQVIKNLQVKISNIHIRYEDDVTNPNVPLSFGVSLQNFSLQTADQNWNPCLLDEKAKLFFKRCMKPSGTLQTGVSQDYHFIFHPISARAKLRMNPRSDVDFSAPKVDLVVSLPEYVSILELLGSVDMMTRNLPYRKYRPNVMVHSHARQWWRYVIVGILEVNVKPRLHMWSWIHIRRHRQHVKKYRELYKNKMTSKKPAEGLLKELEETERTLDIFNITMARQQAEMEASKAGLRIYRPGVKVEEEQSQGWIGWMWSWTGDSCSQTKETKTAGWTDYPSTQGAHRCLSHTGFDGLMTAAEKAKLYAAIGYSETAVNPNLPKHFENMKIDFHLLRLCLSIKESQKKAEIIKLSIIDLKAMLTQRPAAQAMKISAQLSSFEVCGLARGMSAPILLSPRLESSRKEHTLLKLMFETNPLDERADQRLHIESQPLEIIYDAVSLMYIIETQKVLDLKIDLMASYVIIPHNGFYDPKHNLAILDLGRLRMSSQSRANLPQLSAAHCTIEDLMSRAYDSFDILLSSLQFLYSRAGGDWQRARPLRKSSFHILEPLDLTVLFSRAMVVTDSRMPKFKISGELPLVSLCISDDKVRGVLALLSSIPLPESRPVPQNRASLATPKGSKQGNTPQLTPRRPAVDDLRASIIYGSGQKHFCTDHMRASSSRQGSGGFCGANIFEFVINEELFFDAPSSPIEDLQFFEASSDSLQGLNADKRLSLVNKDPKKNMTEFLLRFDIRKLSVQLCRWSHGQEVSVLHLFIDGLGTELKLRTFDMSSFTFLSEICLECSEYLEVTAQAAEKAATGVLELAERSTRISMDVDIKAPVVFLPQSSV
ncbi:hypothetical protein DNTS_035799, partial [Danionella cerebrum]